MGNGDIGYPTIFSCRLKSTEWSSIFSIFLELLFIIGKYEAAAATVAGVVAVEWGGWQLALGAFPLLRSRTHVFSFNYFVRHEFARHINKIHTFIAYFGASAHEIMKLRKLCVGVSMCGMVQ